MWNERTLQIYVTAANDVRMRMDEIMIEMHSAEMIVKGTENVGKCEAQESCKHANSSSGRDIIMSYFASCSMGTFSFRCKRIEVRCSNADY